MSRINVLPKSVAELIAAGEVVERPASAIKEMAENSIDAGAKKLTVEIKNGGVTFIRITDDGSGIFPEDVPKAFLRHATSKIKSGSDLDCISTLGFRGEALAAISAVSRVEMITKPREIDLGTRCVIEGGETVVLEEAGCADGTVITVRDIFYNTPARMKFLKKDVTEANAVAAVMDRIALSHPEVAVRFIRDGATVLNTSGNGNLSDAVYAVCGKEYHASSMPFDGEYEGIRASGLTCLPVACKPTRSGQYVFLNGRFVRSGTVAAALDQAYKNSAMVGKYPYAVVNLTVPFGAVDVNVHPAKTEVRFSDERRIFNAVYYAVKTALASKDRRPSMSIGGKTNKAFTEMPVEKYMQTVLSAPVKEYTENGRLTSPSKIISELNGKKQGAVVGGAVIRREVGKSPELEVASPEVAYNGGGLSEIHRAIIGTAVENHTAAGAAGGNCATTGASTITESAASTNTAVTAGEPAYKKVFAAAESSKTAFASSEAAAASTSAAENPYREDDGSAASAKDDSVRAVEPTPEVRLIGEAFRTYIIVEKGKELYLIDKHAAHERILFEELKKDAGSDRQCLLAGENISLSKEDYDAVVTHIDELDAAGFEIDDFGNGIVTVRSVPSMLVGEKTADLIVEIADSLRRSGKALAARTDDIYHRIACRAAVKAGNVTTAPECEELAKRVLSDNKIMYCPHGRPVAIRITEKELEKQFGRIQ